MKKLLNLLVLLTLCCLDMQADVRIFDTKITQNQVLNHNSNAAITAGSISVDFTSNVITLENLTVNNETGKDVIYIAEDDSNTSWTILVKGICNIKSDITDINAGCHVFYFAATVSIEGYNADGSDELYIDLFSSKKNPNSISSCPISVYQHTLKFNNLKIDINSSYNSPISCTSKIYFITTDVSLTCPSTTKPITTLNKPELVGTEIISSGEVYWGSDSRSYFIKGGKEILGSLVMKVPDYDLIVCGKKVTGYNYEDVLGNKKVKFVPADGTNPPTLWLYNGSVISNSSGSAVRWGTSYTGEHRIAVQGTVRIASSSDVIVDNNTGTLIIEDADPSYNSFLSLTSNGQGYCLYSTGGEVKISNLKMTATTSGNTCLGSQIGSTKMLTIDNSELNLTASTYAIKGFKAVTENNCHTPGFEHYDATSSKRYYVDDYENNAVSTLKTLKGKAYPIKVKGKRITSENASDVLGTGKVSFSEDDDYDVLEFNNAYISYTGILIDIASTCKKGIVIAFTGNNSLATSSMTTKGHAIYNRSSVIPLICGNEDHSLNLYAGGTYGRAIWTESDLYMKNLNATIYNASDSYPALYSNSGGSMFFENCELTVENKGATSQGVLDGFSGATTDLCYFNESFYYPDKGIVNMKEKLLSKIQVKRGYGLEVAGVTVTDANRDDVLGDGTVSYKHPHLTLNNFHCTGEYYGIYSQNYIDIELKGENRIDDTVYGIFNSSNLNYINEPATIIKGTGSLTIETEETGIYARSGGLKIKDCVLNVIGTAKGAWGIRGYRGLAYEGLEIDNAFVNVKGTDGALGWFKSIKTSDNIQLLSPENASVGTYAGCAAVVYSTNNRVRSNVPVIFGNFDFNNDGNINIVDITHLIKKMKTNSSYSSLLKPLKDKILKE